MTIGSRTLPKESRAEAFVGGMTDLIALRIRQDRRLSAAFNELSDVQRSAAAVIMARAIREGMKGAGYYRPDEVDPATIPPGFALANVYADSEIFTLLKNSVKPGIDPDDLWGKLLSVAGPS